MLFIVGLIFLSVRADHTIISGEDSKKSVNILIYQNDLAIVEEVRKYKLKQGENTIIINDLPNKIIQSSIFLTSSNKNIKIQQLRDLKNINYENFLKKRGNKVIIQGRQKEGTIISAEKDRILVNYENRLEYFKFSELIIKDTIQNLNATKIKCISDNEEEAEIKLTYLTRGIDWKAYYSAMIYDSKKIELNAWVNIRNTSGMNIKDAKTSLSKLGFENINEASRLKSTLKHYNETTKIYKLEEFISVDDETETKVEYMIPKDYIAAPNFRIFLPEKFERTWHTPIKQLPVETWLRLENSDGKITKTEESDGKKVKTKITSRDLPRGEIKIYTNKDHPEYLTTSTIHHTPINGIFSVPYKMNSKIFAELYQSEFRMLTKSMVEIEYRLSIKNTNSHAIKLIIIQPTLQSNWYVVKSSVPIFETLEKHIRWVINVPKNATEYLTFRFRIKKEEKNLNN